MKSLNTNPLVKLKPAIEGILYGSKLAQRDLEETRIMIAHFIFNYTNVPIDLVAVLPDYSAFIISRQHRLKVRP